MDNVKKYIIGETFVDSYLPPIDVPSMTMNELKEWVKTNGPPVDTIVHYIDEEDGGKEWEEIYECDGHLYSLEGITHTGQRIVYCNIPCDKLTRPDARYQLLQVKRQTTIVAKVEYIPLT